MVVKKDSSTGEKTHVTQLCGGMGIQVRGGRSFPKMSFLDSVKGWQGTWFYYRDIPGANHQSGLPPYSSERVRASPTLTVEKEEKVGVDILSSALIGVVNAGVNGMDLLETFFSRRIQPLQARAHPTWLYEGPGDSTRVHPEDLTEKEVGTKIKAITCARDNPRGTRLVPAFHKDLPPIEVLVPDSVGSMVGCLLYG
jgi:hypothetical protein